jgi:hypothetical protein
MLTVNILKTALSCHYTITVKFTMNSLRWGHRYLKIPMPIKVFQFLRPHYCVTFNTPTAPLPTSAKEWVTKG